MIVSWKMTLLIIITKDNLLGLLYYMQKAKLKPSRFALNGYGRSISPIFTKRKGLR